MMKILIAEDDKELRQLFSHVLISSGYHVTGVSNGQEALDAIENDYFDLIISDIMMPVLDGYALVRQLRGSCNPIPIMMITARDAFDDMRQGFLSGSDDYMVKPINVNEMVLRVGALLPGSDDQCPTPGDGQHSDGDGFPHRHHRQRQYDPAPEGIYAAIQACLPAREDSDPAATDG